MIAWSGYLFPTASRHFVYGASHIDMAKDTFYFSHDYNSRTDEKLKRLIRKHGMTGYGVWWAIVEDLYNNANALRMDYEGIAFDLHTNSEIIKSVINDFDLFVIKDEFFGSLSIERRLIDRNEKSEKARQSAYSRWINANAMRTQCDGNAIKERKGKESKGKEKKEKKVNNVFAPPNFLEVESYFNENGYSTESAHKFFNYYQSGNWKDSQGTQVKNWKQKAIAVWFKPENKINKYNYDPSNPLAPAPR